MEKNMENEVETGYIGDHGGLGFPKIRCTLLGVPIIRIIIYWGLYWVPFLGNYHIPQLRVVACQNQLLQYRTGFEKIWDEDGLTRRDALGAVRMLHAGFQLL